jgi:hypothetical protein
MRVDTTVTETNIHHPTDSSLLGDGVRVLTRTMKKITKIAGEVGTKLRNRSRSVKLRVLDIARAARAKGPQSQEKLQAELPAIARVNQSGRRPGQAILQRHCGRHQAFERHCEATRARGSTSGNRHDDTACQAGDEADPRASSVVAPAPKARSSACSSHRPKSFERARRPSPTSSAKWSSFRRPKTR